MKPGANIACQITTQDAAQVDSLLQATSNKHSSTFIQSDPRAISPTSIAKKSLLCGYGNFLAPAMHYQPLLF